MKFIVRRYMQIGEELIVEANSSSEARMIVEDDKDEDKIKLIMEFEGDWEVKDVEEYRDPLKGIN